ncbi:protein disulfide-isomerase precursor [Podila epigama]|nr:protein disulfide-isomerase precursor [Podila epigama]
MRISAAIALVAMAATSFLATSVTAGVAVDLDESNFLDYIAYKDLVMINFFTSWCGHCSNLEPEFEKAAKILEPEGVPMARVNCETHSEFCKDHAVRAYPTLKVYKKGKVVDYTSSRKADDLVAYMRKHVGPAVQQLKPEELKAFSESGRVVIVGVLPEGPDREALAETLEKAGEYFRDDFAFGAVESAPDVKGSGVVLYKKFDEGKNVLEGTFNDHTLISFIRAHYTPTIDEMGPKNYKHYLESTIPLGYLFFGSEEDQVKYGKDLEALAKELKGEMNFVYVDGNKYGAHADNVGLEKKWPAFSIQDVVTAAKFPLDQNEELTFERIKAHVEAVREGQLPFQLKSESIPESNDGPVTVVVAHSYKDIVEDETKDVLIEFYAPWCGFCKQLAPIYDEIGSLYKGSDIVIAKIDATANDLPPSVPFHVDGYPTIKFRKAGSKDYIDYKGERSKEGFVSFLAKNAANKVDVGVEIKLKSEAIPESNDGPVTVVVANSYKDIVEDETKDVLVEFYAPWCGFCKMLAPIYEEVGSLYKGSDIIIAKFDATANELPHTLPFQVDGYPTIKFRKAGSKEYIDYKGERSKEGFVTFLAKHAANKVDVGVEIKLKSDAVPESNDGPVTVVVANSYKDIVEDESKDVLIEFYAPWCGFCKRLAPIFDEVGSLYKGSNIVVAKFDATANELPLSLPFQVDGYPTIKFRKAGTKEYIDYNGERSKDAFVSFLAKNAVNKVDVNSTTGEPAHDEL